MFTKLRNKINFVYLFFLMLRADKILFNLKVDFRVTRNVEPM